MPFFRNLALVTGACGCRGRMLWAWGTAQFDMSCSTAMNNSVGATGRGAEWGGRAETGEGRRGQRGAGKLQAIL